MIPDQWRKAKELFNAALRRPPDERLRFLDENCDGDEAVRREVESLLANSEDAAGFLEQPAVGEVAEAIVGDNEKLRAHQSINHYKVIKLIGAGGMGEVYLAEDKKLDRRVAVKILNERFAKHESDLRRFTREAKAVSALNHPNILVIHEIGESQGTNYIVSEFIEGKTLREIVAASPIELTEILDITIQIVSALTAAHGAHIVHRDIKPENIMIRPDGYIKILDFGLAKLIGQKAIGFEEPTIEQNATARGLILGTVNYMSPEQAKGEQIDERTDIFSLGAAVYEMIAGRTPFAGDSMSETFANLINREPQPLSRFSADAPDELQRIVSKMLRKNRDERYQTMKGLLADLKSLQKRLEFEAELGRNPPPDKQLEAETQTFKADKRETTQTTEQTNSIAVLPFANMSNDAENEYFCDGLAEELLNALSKIKDLKVAARTSAFSFKNRNVGVSEIGDALNVKTILEGSVRKAGTRLRISVKLINASSGYHLWSERYDGELKDIFDLQDEITLAVIDELKVKFLSEEQAALRNRYTENVEAYQLYLKGQYEWKKHAQEDLHKAIAYYNQAVELDPNYASAYCGLTESYGVLGFLYLPPNETFPQAKAYAAKALALDDMLAEAHMSLGAIKLFYDWEFAEAEGELKRALALDPNDALSHHLYADSLEIRGRFDEAQAERRRALELDLLSPTYNMAVGETLYFARQGDEAIAQYEKTINLEPRFVRTYFYLGQAYVQKKMYAQAIAVYQKGITQAERHPMLIAALGHAYALSGKREKANQALAELREMSQQHYISPYLTALIYLGLGDKEQAFAWLDKAYQDRSSLLIWLKVEPLFDTLRADPRFQDLLRRVGLMP
jgi:eukaryotic-like serine/threonine-protein kinase